MSDAAKRDRRDRRVRVRIRRAPAVRVEALLDEIRDSIDELTTITHPEQRREAARELIEYIELHFPD